MLKKLVFHGPLIFIAFFAIFLFFVPCSFSNSGPINVSMTILSKSQCKFNNPTSATLNFGTLNPLTPTLVTTNTSINFICIGSDDPVMFTILVDDGGSSTGINGRRMKNDDNNITAFLPYDLKIGISQAGYPLTNIPQSPPLPGTVPKKQEQTLHIIGSVENYQNAIAGNYTDLVTITIQP